MAASFQDALSWRAACVLALVLTLPAAAGGSVAVRTFVEVAAPGVPVSPSVLDHEIMQSPWDPSAGSHHVALAKVALQAAKPEALTRADAILRSLVAGLSTSLGAGIVLLLRGAPTAGQMAFALALAAGVMITVSVVEMWLPLLSKPDPLWEGVLAAALGGLSFAALRNLIPEPQMVHKDEDEENGATKGLSPRQKHQGKQWRLALLLTLALTAHNFPEGLAVAVSSLESNKLGFIVMAAIAVHNIPEGIAIAMPVMDATGSRWQAMLMATLSGLAEPLGALLAVLVVPPSFVEGHGMALLLAYVGGIMSCVAAVELLPEAQAQNRFWATVGGLVAGSGIMLLTHELA